MVRISNTPARFALNTCNSFGCTTAGGLFGFFGDALTDLLCARGIGPILKWVDDFIFFRIPTETLLAYNQLRAENHRVVAKNGGILHSGGRLWCKGRPSPKVGTEHFTEDLAFPLRYLQQHENDNISYPYDFVDINSVTTPLGIPWKASKDVHFSSTVPFIGFAWDLVGKRVLLPEAKKIKYLQAITEWRSKVIYTLDDVQKLYGKLLYACLIVLCGRAYLTGLEKMMGVLQPHPFTPRHPPKAIAEDLIWWFNTLSRPSLSREIPRGRPIMDVRGFVDASSSVGISVVISDKWRAWCLLPNWRSGG